MASSTVCRILAAFLIADGPRLLAAAVIREEPLCEGAVCQDLSSRAEALMQAKNGVEKYTNRIEDFELPDGAPEKGTSDLGSEGDAVMQKFEREQTKEERELELAARNKTDAKEGPKEKEEAMMDAFEEEQEKEELDAFEKEQEKEEAELERRNKTGAENETVAENSSESVEAGNHTNASAPATATPAAPTNTSQAASTTAAPSANATCVTRKDSRASAMGFTTADPGTPCVFGVDERDEGYHCIPDNGNYGSYGWCWTSKSGTSWGSCSENCPLFGSAKTLGDKIEELDKEVDELKKVASDLAKSSMAIAGKLIPAALQGAQEQLPDEQKMGGPSERKTSA